MKKKNKLHIAAVILLFVLITFTGCSIFGGPSDFCGNFSGCFFEKAGCTMDCLINIEPYYCLCVTNGSDCDNCYETLLVTPCYVCADEQWGKYDNENPDVILLSSADAFGQYNQDEENKNAIGIVPKVGEGRETEVSCDGDYVRLETDIYVHNESSYDVEDAYISIKVGEYEYRRYYLGDIPAGEQAMTVHYEYRRQGETFNGKKAESIFSADVPYAIYGKVIKD